MQVNEYFDGNVKSIGFENSEGRATAGVMAVGDYEFGTAEKEWMKIISGQLQAKLPGSDRFESFAAGSDFRVEANQKFQVKVEQSTAYLCFYGD
ncbi:MAG: pyrimidine/purine nucleoside phosphorylase [Pirellulaceae bacterium]|nr:pyrimidine/purine nucleoside phosphorylase [Pirellulaceae bacterium]